MNVGHLTHFRDTFYNTSFNLLLNDAINILTEMQGSGANASTDYEVSSCSGSSYLVMIDETVSKVAIPGTCLLQT